MHTIKTFDQQGKCLSSNDFSTAERAVEEFYKDTALLRSRLPKGEEVTVARYSFGDLMTTTTIIGTK